MLVQAHKEALIEIREQLNAIDAEDAVIFRIERKANRKTGDKKIVGIELDTLLLAAPCGRDCGARLLFDVDLPDADDDVIEEFFDHDYFDLKNA